MAFNRVNILTKSARQHIRLLVNFFGHEVTIIAFIDHCGGGIDRFNRALHRRICGEVENLCSVTRHNCPIAIGQIADPIGKGGKRKGIRAKKHLALAIAKRQRAAASRDDDLVFIAVNNQRNGKCALQRRKGFAGCVMHIVALPQVLRKQMGNHFSVRVRQKRDTVGQQLVFQLFVIFDNAVMHHRHAFTAMRMGIGFCCRPVCCPTRMADADCAFNRFGIEPMTQRLQLAFGATTDERAIGDNGDTGTVIAAIFQPLQPVK